MLPPITNKGKRGRCLLFLDKPFPCNPSIYDLICPFLLHLAQTVSFQCQSVSSLSCGWNRDEKTSLDAYANTKIMPKIESSLSHFLAKKNFKF